MTYYGVWSGKEWWRVGNGMELFRTPSLAVARAQARAANKIWETDVPGVKVCWQAHPIGEDGLPQRTMEQITSDLEDLAAGIKTWEKQHPGKSFYWDAPEPEEADHDLD